MPIYIYIYISARRITQCLESSGKNAEWLDRSNTDTLEKDAERITRMNVA
jgi:hypothetical protein